MKTINFSTLQPYNLTTLQPYNLLNPKLLCNLRMNNKRLLPTKDT